MKGEEIEVTAVYDQDTKRTHRFVINIGEPVSGTLYVPKTSKVPASVKVNLQVRGAYEDEGEDE